MKEHMSSPRDDGRLELDKLGRYLKEGSVGKMPAVF